MTRTKLCSAAVALLCATLFVGCSGESAKPGEKAKADNSSATPDGATAPDKGATPKKVTTSQKVALSSPVKVVSRDGGAIAGFTGPDGKPAGLAKLWLGDRTGELEVWLATTKGMTFDVPLDTVIQVKMIDKKGRTVELRIKDKKLNHFEDAKSNIRNGKSNYFVFPGDREVDVRWLASPIFRAVCVVSFTVDGKRYTTQSFALTTPQAAHGHSHGRR